MNICNQDKKHTFPSYNPKERLIALSGEAELWREVLCDAIETAKFVTEDKIPTLSHIRSLKNDPNAERRAKSKRDSCLVRRRQHEMERESARRFISRKGDMFDMICEWLDLPAEKYRERIMAQWE